MTEYEKLQKIIDEANELINQKAISEDAKFKAWQNKASRFLKDKYGEKSYEFTEFNNTVFTLLVYALGTPNTAFVKACKEGLEQSIEIFKTYLDDCKKEANEENIKNQGFSKIFIVHGHDGELKQSVARIIEKQDIEAIILSEQANLGKTIIEKFEDYSDVDAAICLFTPDDFGNKNNLMKKNARARQNVVFETGYFMGKLGRKNVIIIAESKIEMPSDLSGIVYTDNKNWEIDLLKELKYMGYNIDFNKLI